MHVKFSSVLVASQLPSLCGRVVCSQRIEYACLGPGQAARTSCSTEREGCCEGGYGSEMLRWPCCCFVALSNYKGIVRQRHTLFHSGHQHCFGPVYRDAGGKLIFSI